MIILIISSCYIGGLFFLIAGLIYCKETVINACGGEVSGYKMIYLFTVGALLFLPAVILVSIHNFLSKTVIKKDTQC